MARTNKSRGQQSADTFFDALRQAQQAPTSGARGLPLLTGLEPGGVATEPMENVLARADEILIQSKRIYRYGSAAVMETDDLAGEGRTLVTLRQSGEIERGAAGWLSNLILCRAGDFQFPLPRPFTEVLLRHEPLNARLPRIRLYANRPMFDRDFCLCDAGWHPDNGILVHGPSIDPVEFHPVAPGARALDRLPIHLRTLLAGFCFRADADLVNCIALMLTNLLVNHFVVCGKPVALFDGNQVSVGKTSLVRIIGLVFDGAEPYDVKYTTDDDELAKRLCAKFRGGHRSVLMIDNCKIGSGQPISSPLLESSAMSPEIALRILGLSADYVRPNDLIWAITMNSTRISPDLVSRGIPVQLHYDEGRADTRRFSGPHPLDYAREHRLEILGELAGMVVHWNQRARPMGGASHRCHQWAALVSGILEAAGFPEILTNAQEAQSFDSTGDELAALAEAVIADNGPYIFEEVLSTNPSKSLPAAQWGRFFATAKVRMEELGACKGEHAHAICIGKFFTPLVGQVVPIQLKGRTGTAMLEVLPGRGREKRYQFRVRLEADSSAPADGGKTTGVDVDTEGFGSAMETSGVAPTVPVDATVSPENTSVTTDAESTKNSPATQGDTGNPADNTSAGGPAGNKEAW